MSKTSSKVKNKWNKNNYDRITIIIKKGSKDIIKSHATSKNESVNSFIIRAIENQIDNEK